jgi:hypothetical protein
MKQQSFISVLFQQNTASNASQLYAHNLTRQKENRHSINNSKGNWKKKKKNTEKRKSGGQLTASLWNNMHKLVRVQGYKIIKEPIFAVGHGRFRERDKRSQRQSVVLYRLMVEHWNRFNQSDTGRLSLFLAEWSCQCCVYEKQGAHQQTSWVYTTASIVAAHHIRHKTKRAKKSNAGEVRKKKGTRDGTSQEIGERKELSNQLSSRFLNLHVWLT